MKRNGGELSLVLNIHITDGRIFSRLDIGGSVSGSLNQDIFKNQEDI